MATERGTEASNAPTTGSSTECPWTGRSPLVRRRGLLLSTAVLLAAALLPGCGEDGPRRVLLVGDSLMNQTGAALTNILRDDDVRNEGVNGSGLLTPAYLDWPAQLRRLLDRFDPDVVVFRFVGNFDLGTGETYTAADGHVIESRRDPAFYDAWQAQARRMTDQAEEAGAEVVWVLPPPNASFVPQANTDRLREGYEDLGTTTVDANEVLADEDGEFLPEAEDGTPLRNDDGLHLATEGARRLARLVADEIS